MTVMMTTTPSSSFNYHRTAAVGGCGSSLPVVIPPRSTSPSSTMSGPSKTTATTATVAMTATVPTGRGTYSSSGLSFVPHRRRYSGPSLSASSASASNPTTTTTTSSRMKHRLSRRTYNDNRNDYAYYGDTTANVDSSSSHVVVVAASADVNNARYQRAVAFMQHFRRLHSLDIIDEHEDDSTMTKMKTMKRSETTSCLTSLVVDVEEDDEDRRHNGRTDGGGRGDDDGHHTASSVSASCYNFKNKRSRHLSFVEDDYVSDIDSIVEEGGLNDDDDDCHYDHHDNEWVGKKGCISTSRPPHAKFS